MDHFCYLCLVFIEFSCLFIVALWSPAGKGLTSWLTRMRRFIVFCHFPKWCPGSGVVLVESIPGLCLLSYFDAVHYISGSAQSDKSLCYVLNE